MRWEGPEVGDFSEDGGRDSVVGVGIGELGVDDSLDVLLVVESALHDVQLAFGPSLDDAILLQVLVALGDGDSSVVVLRGR